VYYRLSGFGIQANVLSYFEECMIVFQAPAQFPKNKDVSNYPLQLVSTILVDPIKIQKAAVHPHHL